MKNKIDIAILNYFIINEGNFIKIFINKEYSYIKKNIPTGSELSLNIFSWGDIKKLDFNSLNYSNKNENNNLLSSIFLIKLVLPETFRSIENGNYNISTYLDSFVPITH